jgi:hypothetical protein
MVDFILLVFVVLTFLVGVWVGATFGGIPTLYKKIRLALRDKLDDDKTQ